MNQNQLIKIIDITNKPRYKNLLINCIFHRKRKIPLRASYRRRKARVEYLKSAIPKGFHMKILFNNEDHVGMIEYGPPKAAGLPITGKNIIVMNCIWVHRRAQGNNFGKILMQDMTGGNKHAAGFATIALEKYWMHWMQKSMMGKLGFQSVRSVKLRHKSYEKGQCFIVHLMWLPKFKRVPLPTWNESQLLYGVDFCPNHPMYWGRYGYAKLGFKKIYKKC